ncbi:unnamed protein product [Mytilus edulis]|uniref:Uncharacterized protein n=1 Tax=Mytilus edulis TaxID=6550 RepID=A0A8S3U2L0_MYTED|nr:unnamed protein product [Mytilus edulis]
MIRQKFNISIRNQYQTLQNISENNDNIGPDLNEHWNKVKTMFNDTAVNVLGIRDSTRKRWISDTTWNVIEKRRSTKSKYNQARSERLKEKLQIEYSELNKEVKKKARKDKLQYIEGLANEAEEACKHGELKVADSGIHFLQKLLLSKRTEQQVRVNSIRRAKLILFYTLRVPDQREFKTVISLDPLEHYLGNTDGASNFSILDNPIRLQKCMLT